ncbi:Ig-like domain repeat protein, partial [Candidatus Bipolaricaulota bacterium]|nr:Ig-like domain repeat protein [Candidatus Bipolaricaulota bacterium]
MKQVIEINIRFKARHSMFSSHRWILVLSALLACIITIGVSGFAGTATTTTLASSLNPSTYGQDVTFTATVAPVPDGGTVEFKDGGTSIASVAVNTTTGKASFTTNSLSVGTHVITAAYSGTTNYDPSTSNTVNQVVKRASKVVVFCADTPLIVNTPATGTVTITGVPDAGSAPPTGKVHLSHTGNGTLSPSTYTLQESDGGQFEFTYTPADGDNSPHVITASYDGDSEYAPGTDTFEQEVTKRAVDIQMSLSPTSVYVLQPVTVSIHVEDDTTAGSPPAGWPNGIEISLDDGGAGGTFSDDTPALNGSGNCTVTYTPGPISGSPPETVTITASYTESSVYMAKSVSQSISVDLRPTQTTVKFDTSEGILVNESTGLTVTVKDMA